MKRLVYNKEKRRAGFIPGITVLAFCFFCAAPSLFALDWPSPNGVIKSGFGWNDGGRPTLGISFETEEIVRAAGPGEILFSGGQEGNPSKIPSPLGAWTALDHGDGIISVYSRMENQSESYIPNAAELNTRLGQAGVSGWSSSKGFYFFLFDRKERRWINPAMLIDPRPDTRQPVILSVSLKDAEGDLIDPARTRTLRQGRYVISVAAEDTMTGAQEPPLAPYRIVCSVNGVETGALNFETYSARNGESMVYRNGLVPVKEVFAPYPAWEVGEIRFTRGQATLEIIVQDYSGNSRNSIYRLQIE